MNIRCVIQSADGAARRSEVLGEMKITHTQTEATDILVLSGRIDATTSPDFESRLLELVKDVNAGCVLDFHEVDYVSSAGLRVLLVALRRFNGEKKMLIVARPSENVKEVITLTGFHKLLKICDSMQEASEAVLAKV